MLSARCLRDTWLEFTVTDTGPGFSEQALEHALEPFFTTKGGEGSGLGLAMVYDMTKLAGGRVQLSNTDSGGRVTIRLPLRRAKGGAAPGLVLLVEDSPDLRGTIRDMLRADGHSVVEAASATEALALFRELPEISAILSDISLDGGETGLDPAGRAAAGALPGLPDDVAATGRSALPAQRPPARRCCVNPFRRRSWPRCWSPGAAA